MKYIFWFFAFVTFTETSWASCLYNEHLDLRTIYPQVFRSLPIKDQGDYGICYADAATTMIDFLRILRKTDHYQDRKTNPVDAAETASIFTTDGNPEGGEICDVAKALVKRGYGCDSLGALPDQLKDVGMIAQREVVNQVFMDYILNKKVFKPLDPKYVTYENRKTLNADQRAYINKFDEYMTWMRTYLAVRGFGPDALPTDTQFFTFVQNIQATNAYDVFPASFEALLGKKNCMASSFKMPALTCQKTALGYDNSMMTKIDDQLKAQLPIGVDICASVLTNHSYAGGNIYKDDTCGAHALVVIGKKEEGGQCLYLLRNSWGANYRYYDWTTDHGDVWVSESAMRANVFGVSTIQ